MIVDKAVYRDGQRYACGDLSQELARLHREPANSSDFMWVGLKDPEPEELRLVQTELDLHPLAMEDLIKGKQRPKAETYDQTLIVVAKTLRYVEATSDIETGDLMAIVGPHLVVTVRHGDVAGLKGVRTRMESDEHEDHALLLEGPMSVVYGLLDRVVDTYREIDDEVGDDLANIERDVFGGGNQTQSTTIYRLKREVLEFRRAAQPLEAVLRLLVAPGGPVESDELRLHFRDVADHLAVVIQSIDSYDALLSDVLSAHLSQIGVQQNADMRRISAWAAMIAMPTMLAGIYGMNFTHMPELDWPIGYPLAVLGMALAVFVLWRLFKRSGWL